MEVFGDTEHHGLVLRDALDLVAPLARNLDGRLDRFRARVHRQDHLEPEQFRHELCESGEHIVVEGAAAERQPRGLLGQDLDQLGMAVALVDCAVRRQEVEIRLALRIPDRAATGSGEDDLQRMVVVSGIGGLGGDGFVRRSGMKAGRVGRLRVWSRCPLCLGCSCGRLDFAECNRCHDVGF